MWVFYDPAASIVKEPNISGVDDVIDTMVNSLANPSDEFIFQYMLDRQHKEFDGWWYSCNNLDLNGWLSPALFKYVDSASEELYFKVKQYE
jgi:hypothetical protein